MSNNRSNNRRRGRGNNRSQGGNQLNRIDSRAWGNAPQLLEKYRKLAHDASLNGDRVQAEYYLQFADHYFRVIADSRAQKDEVRPRRDADRDSSDDYDYYDDDPMEPRGRGQNEDSSGYYDGDRESESDNSRSDNAGAGEARAEPRRDARGEPRGEERADERDANENPFIRDSRNRGRRPRRSREPDAQAHQPEESAGLDPSALPPAISVREEATGEDAPEAAAAAPEAPRRRGRPRTRRKDDDEALEAVG